jgi:iron complex transport system ATP-binding protein
LVTDMTDRFEISSPDTSLPEKALLQVVGLNIAYDEFQVIRDLHLEVHPGEVLGLIGPNGAGKTTLIRAISGVLKVKSGSISCLGKDLLNMEPADRARLLAVVPQARQLGGALTVEQTVLMGRTAYMGFLGRPADEDREIVWRAMEQTQVNTMAHRRNSELSSGEQQRVLLARALAQKTTLLLMDEPTSHLDISHQASFLNLVRELAGENNLSIMMAFHDLNMVSGFTDRLGLIVDGELRALGSPREVLTAEQIQAAYNTPVRILDHPDLDTPIIIPEWNDNPGN